MWMLERPESFQPWAYWIDAFTEDELNRVYVYGDTLKRERGFISEVGVDESVRKSDVSWVPETEEYGWLYDKMAYIAKKLNDDHFHLDLKAFEQFQWTRYDGAESGHYGQHVDCAYEPNPGRFRKLSFTLQLSDPAEYDGGELVLYPDSLRNGVTVEKKRGLLTFFRSHVIHEVLPVTRGVRKSLVGWIQGPLPK